MIIRYLKTYKQATFSELFKLLDEKLSNVLSDEQKQRRIRYLLSCLKSEGKINVEGRAKKSVWRLS